MTTEIFNFAVKRGGDGSKHLDLQIRGVIDGGWLDEESVSTAKMSALVNEHLDAKTITCRINSIGGSMFGGIAMHNVLAQHPAEVTCIVEGLAASAASLIAMAGKLVMGRGAMLMVHSPLAGVMGNARELRQTADLLDKAQEGLCAIYEQKTGKSRDEINALLNAETWMSAEEAVASGFADVIAGEGDEGHWEPDGDEDADGNEPDGPEEPTALGDLVVWNHVAFPKAALPERLVAMAKPAVVQAAVDVLRAALDKAGPCPRCRRQRCEAHAVKVGAMAKPDIGHLASINADCDVKCQKWAMEDAARSAAVTPIINRAYLAEKHPEIVAALLEEGRAAGVAAERARLKAIDDLPALGCGELVAAAKYGDQPVEASALAVQIVKAQKGVGAELLAARALESAPLSNLGAPAPDAAANASSEKRLVAAIAAGGNARRGVTR